MANPVIEEVVEEWTVEMNVVVDDDDDG